MPGSGKTYWMQQLTNFYNCSGLDLDHEIEKHTGKTISRIFEQGEAHFRDVERIVLNSIVSGSHARTIIATGGGTPCFHNNIDIMNKHGLSIYLKAPVGLLARNILQSQDERPLLKNLNTSEVSDKIKIFLHGREKFYKRATITVSMEQISLATFAGILQSYISR